MDKVFTERMPGSNGSSKYKYALRRRKQHRRKKYLVSLINKKGNAKRKNVRGCSLDTRPLLSLNFSQYSLCRTENILNFTCPRAHIANQMK